MNPGNAELFDVAIIGSGPGGYVAAIHGAQLGLKVALIEKENIGGVCLNVGCIPTKTLLKSAGLLARLRESADFGLRVGELSFDWAQAQARKDEVVKMVRGGVEVLLYKNKITVLKGVGRIAERGRVGVTGGDGREEVIQAHNIVVATGSAPKSLPGVEIDEKRIVSNTGALQFKEIPASLVVIGAGAVGVEFASLYRTLGSEVALVEALPRILPLEDEEISAALEAALAEQGVKIMAGARVGEVKKTKGGVTVQVTAADGTAHTLAAERLLLAVGRAALTERLGLEKVGARLERGYVVVDEKRKAAQGVYAIGDCVPTLWLAHVASAEGRLAVEQIAGREVTPINYDKVPRCTYCRPEVASVGLSEAQARERGYDVRVGRFPFKSSAKALVEGEREGFIKVVAEARYDEVLGVHMIGPHVTEGIAEAAATMRLETTAEELANTIHAHPTLAEALGEAAAAVAGRAIHL
jgi:dihydrolipoamide dehydrogenase